MLACNPCAVSSGRPPPPAGHTPTGTPSTSPPFSNFFSYSSLRASGRSTFGRGKKRKKVGSNNKQQQQSSDVSRDWIETEDNAALTTTTTTTSYASDFVTRVKHFLPGGVTNVTSVTNNSVTSNGRGGVATCENDGGPEKKTGHVVNNNGGGNSIGRSYGRMWKRRRKVSDDNLLNDITTTSAKNSQKCPPG